MPLTLLELKLTMSLKTNKPLFDLSYLIEISGGDADFIKEMVRLFIEQTTTTLIQIDNALATEDFDRVSKLAHKIKSSIDNMGIKSASEKIRSLETAASNMPDVESLNKLFNDISTVLNCVNMQLLKTIEVTSRAIENK